MNKVNIENNQSVLDIAIQISGGIEGVISLIESNSNLAIESNLRGGIVLSHEINPTKISNYMAKNSIKPATADVYNAPYYDGEFTNDFTNEFE